MIGKSNIADCDENCKYEGLYETYKNVHDDIRKKFISQTIVTVLLLFAVTITVVYLLYCGITGKYNDNSNRVLMAMTMTIVVTGLWSSVMILPIIAEEKKLLKGYKIRLSNIAANKIAEHVYRIQSIEDIKNENIFTDEGRLNKRESILHCIDDSGNTMDVYIDPNKSYWFDENDNNILSTDGIVSELLFSDDGETSETGVIKYTVNDKTVYIKEVNIEEIYESED